jgi:hypothetical protein
MYGKSEKKYFQTNCMPAGILLNVNSMKQSLFWPIAGPDSSRRVGLPDW